MNKMYKMFKVCGVSIAMSAVLSACGGTDAGYDIGYEHDQPIVFDSKTTAVTITDKQEGTVKIDLTKGATMGGKAIAADAKGILPVHWKFNGAEMRYPRDNWANGADPQALADAGSIEIYPNDLPIPQIGDDKITPFHVDGTTLVVTPSMFDDALHSCDDTDNIPTLYEGAIGSSTITQQGDGIIDYPSTHTYNIDYSLDNGAGSTKHTIVLTVTADPDTVTDLAVPATLSVPLGATVDTTEGDQAVKTVPYYACNAKLDYKVKDTSIASVDADGKVKGLKVGDTTLTVTSEENPELSKEIPITVTASFYLSSNEDEPGKKAVPACTMSAVRVDPHQVGGSPTGAYDYTWSSSNAAMPIAGTTPMGFGQIAKLDGGADNSFAGTTTTVGVALKSGDTSGADISAIAPLSVDVTVVNNQACETINVYDKATPWTFDYQMEDAAFNGGVHWQKEGGTTVATAPGLVGNGVKITLDTVDTANYENDPNGMWYQNWSTGNNNFFGATLGRNPESHGVTFSTNVWVKLDTAASGPITLRQYIYPWQFTNHKSYAGTMRRTAPLAAVFEATLQNTTEWQYVEFKNKADGGRTFTVPDSWNADGKAEATVIPEFLVYGLDQGDSVTFDEYSLVVKNP